jgi:transaldolase
MFISRWDKAIEGKVSDDLRNRLGIAIAKQAYKSYRGLLQSERWQKLAKAGAQPQVLLWGSTGTKDPKASDVLYVEALAAPETIDTIPEKTLQAFADHGQVKGVLPDDGGDAEQVLAEFSRAGVDITALAEQLQREGAEAFEKSWNDLMDCLRSKSQALKKAG